MSTVHICLKDILGVAVKCEVIFYPGDTPFQNGAAMAVSGRRSVWLDAEGNGSVQLLAGSYAVRFGNITGNTDTLIIQVPDDTATYELTALITAGNWALPMRDMLQKAKNLGDIADASAAFSAIKQAASTAATGVVQLATQAEVNAGADDAKAVTPATLAGATQIANLTTALAAKADVSALPAVVTVADSTALFALTSSDVKAGDRVVVSTGDTGSTEYYEMIDSANLGSYAAFGTLRDGLVSFDAGKILSNGSGVMAFNGSDGAEKMRMSGTEYVDFAGTCGASITFENDGADPIKLYGDSLGDFWLSAYTVNFETAYLNWGSYLTFSVTDGITPVTKLEADQWIFRGTSGEIGSLTSAGIFLNGSLGLFGKTALISQPSAIANATDLASALTAINAWLAVARNYGFIKSS
jgi:hypothetical protein